MPKMKIFLLCLLLVLTIQACAPQVVTVVVTSVVTAAPTGVAIAQIEPTLKGADATATLTGADASPIPSSTPEILTPTLKGADATLVPSPTSKDAPIATLKGADATPAPSLTAAPVVKVTPATLPLPAVSNLPAQGPVGGDIDFGVVMSSTYLMRIKAKKHGTSNDGDGIDHVLFIVNRTLGDNVYSRTEKTAKYCIFGGGEPDCNPWPVTNGRYTWGVGGPAIVSGNYQVIIRIALKGDPTNESQWTFGITIKLPS